MLILKSKFIKKLGKKLSKQKKLKAWILLDQTHTEKKCSRQLWDIQFIFVALSARLKKKMLEAPRSKFCLSNSKMALNVLIGQALLELLIRTILVCSAQEPLSVLKFLVTFSSFSDNLLQDAYIIFQKSADNSEICSFPWSCILMCTIHMLICKQCYKVLLFGTDFRDVSWPAFAGIPAVMKFNSQHLFIFSPFWRLLVQIHIRFQAFSFRSA